MELGANKAVVSGVAKYVYVFIFPGCQLKKNYNIESTRLKRLGSQQVAINILEENIHMWRRIEETLILRSPAVIVGIASRESKSG